MTENLQPPTATRPCSCHGDGIGETLAKVCGVLAELSLSPCLLMSRARPLVADSCRSADSPTCLESLMQFLFGFAMVFLLGTLFTYRLSKPNFRGVFMKKSNKSFESPCQALCKHQRPGERRLHIVCRPLRLVE